MIGTIHSIGIRRGGYQDAMLEHYIVVKNQQGLHTFAEVSGWMSMPGPNAEWSHDSRLQKVGAKTWKIVELMKDAKVSDSADLIGKPVQFIDPSDNFQARSSLSHIKIITDLIP